MTQFNPHTEHRGKTMAAKITAVYLRVSTDAQSTRSQLADVDAWVRGHSDVLIEQYVDHVTGKTLDRKAWAKLWAGVERGEVDRIVIWRLDRLGRSTAKVCDLFDELTRRGVTLVSLREGFDLATPAGKLVASVLASVAQYETEVRLERVHAGIAAAKAGGKTWGGSKKGWHYKDGGVTSEQIDQVLKLDSDGEPRAAIARATGLSRATVYRLLGHAGRPARQAARRQATDDTPTQ
jgi:DNA invertase Pin-like site-specific DNA recombinase